jgi:hypothetical protein
MILITSHHNVDIHAISELHHFFKGDIVRFVFINFLEYFLFLFWHYLIRNKISFLHKIHLSLILCKGGEYICQGQKLR